MNFHPQFKIYVSYIYIHLYQQLLDKKLHSTCSCSFSRPGYINVYKHKKKKLLGLTLLYCIVVSPLGNVLHLHELVASCYVQKLGQVPTFWANYMTFDGKTYTNDNPGNFTFSSAEKCWESFAVCFQTAFIYLFFI